MIDLPDWPAPASAEPALIDFGGELTPSLGGPVQRIERMGSRFSLAVTMPPMKFDKVAREWLVKLMKAKQEGGRLEWPMLDFSPGLPGSTIAVNGAGQSGRTLNVDGAPEGYVFRVGQPFNIISGGVYYLHFVTSEVIVGAPGTASLSIEPMLRVSPSDGALLEVGTPKIEGFISGNELPWSMDVARIIGLSFTITERR